MGGLYFEITIMIISDMINKLAFAYRILEPNNVLIVVHHVPQSCPFIQYKTVCPLSPVCFADYANNH